MSDSVAQSIGMAVTQNRALSREGALERMFARLFRGLVYAQIWEDPVADMGALGLTGKDHILCIGSGGCNMMSYLTAGPASITVVDLSPAHVALNRLKLAAARHLPDHATFYAMFGHGDRAENITAFDTHIAPHLDPETLAFWNAPAPLSPRKEMLARGLYRHGVLGRFLGAVRLVTRIAGVDFRPYFAARTLDEQRAFYESHLAPLFESRVIRFLANRRASLFGLGIPPAQFDKLAADGGGDIVKVLNARARKLFCDFPVDQNYFAWQAATRGYKPDGTGPVPLYLAPGSFETLKANAKRVTVLNRSLTDLLAETPDGSKSAFVFLDAQDWMTPEQLTALWTEVTRTATPGARVLFRTGGAPDILPGQVPRRLLDQWSYDAGASAKAHRQDRSAIYGGVHLYRRRGAA